MPIMYTIFSDEDDDDDDDDEEVCQTLQYHEKRK